MKQLDFSVPFSGFAGTNFINCFSSVFLYLEGMTGDQPGITFCNEWENGECNHCGHCDTKPQTLQERYYFLFDTMCGRSSMRNHFDDRPLPTDSMICYGGDGDGAAENNIDFLFGFAGYDYHVVTDAAAFGAEITASLEKGRPVIAKLTKYEVPCAVITGLDGDKLLCPNYKGAQKSPPSEMVHDDVAALYVVDGKTKPKYTLIDGLKRIEQVMQSALSEDVWGEYCKKMGTYGPDSLGEDKPEGRRERMHRLAGEMWHTFNCHNFAEVFRVYCPGSANPNIYDAMYDVNRLSDPELSDDINFISEHYAKNHDLAWSIIGLDECINWDDWKSHYYGDMIREILLKLKENDEAVLERIRAIIQKL